MATTLKGYWPKKLSFTESCSLVMMTLLPLRGASPGRIPELGYYWEAMESLVILTITSDRTFPKVVKVRPSKYPKRGKNASQLSN